MNVDTPGNSQSSRNQQKYKCIHQLFEAHVDLNGNTVAVVYEHESLTYRQLNTRANFLAHYLQVLGVGPEVLVGICMERSLEMIVGLLGILKAGGAYVPPSVEGQAAVISEALAIAQIDPSTVTYVETHGTATSLGDPIEITALTQAFRQSTEKTGFCAIGSVKTNIGHIAEAAGSAGLIKTVLALRHKIIPPSLHFSQPNPNIDFENSPFYVNTTLSEWKANGTPRRAGVSALEEAPRPGRPRMFEAIVRAQVTAIARQQTNRF